MDFENEEPLVIKVFFMTQEDFEIDLNYEEYDYLKAIALLNQNYNQFNIFFKYLGFEYVDDIFDHPNNPTYPDRITFRITNGDGGAASGFPDQYSTTITYKAFTNEEDKDYLIVHEVGHRLGLIHTNGVDTAGTDNNFINPLFCNGNTLNVGRFPSFNGGDPSVHENVTRDVNNVDDYNATEAGDLVADTPATYKEVNLCINNSSGTPVLEYLYSDEVRDLTDTPYENIDVNNFMISDNRLEYHKFKDQFTDGQGIRMRETILNAAYLQDARTWVSSLYEPYAGSYYFAGPLDPNAPPLFQPGFDYKFVSAGGPGPNGLEIYNTPSDYDDISFSYDSSVILNEVNRFSLDLDAITHPNDSAIVIEQLELQPRKCYYNRNWSPIGGKIIKFQDNIPNENYLITDQDSTAINNPTLIDELDDRLYIIRKEYNNGSHEQETLLKTGNQ